MNEFHEDMIAHDKAVREGKTKESKPENEIWEDVLFKFSTEIMTQRESNIIADLIKKYKIQER